MNETRTLPRALERLSESSLVVADSAEDVRGRKVLDSAGSEIGSVEDLMIDGQERKVRFLLVAAGGFLGIGEKMFLVPVDALADVSDDEVRIAAERERVTGGPEYQPSLVDEEELTRHYGRAYEWYGYAPYWTPGYAYPTYPYYGRR